MKRIRFASCLMVLFLLVLNWKLHWAKNNPE